MSSLKQTGHSGHFKTLKGQLRLPNSFRKGKFPKIGIMVFVLAYTRVSGLYGRRLLTQTWFTIRLARHLIGPRKPEPGKPLVVFVSEKSAVSQPSGRLSLYSFLLMWIISTAKAIFGRNLGLSSLLKSFQFQQVLIFLFLYFLFLEKSDFFFFFVSSTPSLSLCRKSVLRSFI